MIKDNKLLSKLMASSTIKGAAILSESKFFTDIESVRTRIPALNVAFSGSMKGGFSSGITVLAGESKCFKTTSALVAVNAYLTQYPEAICIYYDTEFGAPPAYLKAAGIDLDRVIHTPIMDLEELKFDMIHQLDQLKRKDKVIFFIDSIGNVASKKELEDAKEQKSVADLSRARQLKSFFRLITPQLKVKDLPCFVINHIYKTMEMYSTDKMSGGTGPLLSADTVIFISKAVDKEGTEVVGFRFTYNIEKGRFTKEKSKLYVEVNFKDGISKFSGLFDMAMDSGHIEMPTKGWYIRKYTDPTTGEVITDTKNWRRADSYCNEFWGPIMKDPTFHAWVEENYKIANVDLIKDEDDSALALSEDD